MSLSTSSDAHAFVPAIDDVRDAARQLTGHAVRTPLLESPLLNKRVGGRVLVKAEVLQRTGSFKFRGAFNHISRLTAEQMSAGVVAYSSGNHAQGVAAAAAMAGTKATIIMPANAPALKIANTESLGAEVITYDRDTESREKIGEEFARSTGARLVRPYDDSWVIAGQGTVGLEIVEQCRVLEASPAAILAPAGGGGLIAGTSLAVKDGLADSEVIACEPVGFDDHRKSLEAGDRVKNQPSSKSFCDALLAPMPGELAFSINRQYLAGSLAVTDEEVAFAMMAAFQELKIVVEPGGAVALAAILSGKYDASNKTVVAITSGGNVDPATFASVLQTQGNKT